MTLFKQQLLTSLKSDPLPYGSVLVVLIGFALADSSTRSRVLPTVGGFLIAASLYLYKSFTKAVDVVTTEALLKTESTTTTTTSTSSPTLKNIWETSQSDTSGPLKTTHKDKPFGSKYYYAHNNPDATGGYKDGLRMQDYTMNGPRLLQKGGKPVRGDELTISVDNPTESFDVNETNVNRIEPTTTTIPRLPIRIISKYLWDDPGNAKGIATIRIDSLPDKNGQQVAWMDIKFNEITADLKGEGLLVKIETDECRYQLNIGKLYGDAADVKTVIKPKRLMIRIIKKKTAVLAARKESNLDAWPRPHRSI